MAIPKRLRLRPVSQELVDEMTTLCDEIERALESGGSAQAKLERWHLHAGRQVEPDEFRSYWEACSQEVFVREALNPPPSFDSAATYAEAVAVLDAVLQGEVEESDEGYYFGWLEEQFPDANMTDLVHWPDVWFGDPSLFRDRNGAFKPEVALSLDQILTYAMLKSGRQLPGAPEGVKLPFPLPEVSPRTRGGD